MKKMKRAAQLSDDTDQLRRGSNSAAHWHGPWRRCTTTSCFGLTELIFGIEQPMADAHSNDTELFLAFDLRPSSACPGPRFDVRPK